MSQVGYLCDELNKAKSHRRSLLTACKQVLRQVEQVYTKGDPKTEGLCLSIRCLKGAIKQAKRS